MRCVERSGHAVTISSHYGVLALPISRSRRVAFINCGRHMAGLGGDGSAANLGVIHKMPVSLE